MSDTPTANPSYALGQLARVLKTGECHIDAPTRQRAMKKASAWTAVLAGMTSGHLTIGSRAPVVGTPSWATLRVVKGGFATGALLAGGEAQPHELVLLDRIGGTDGESMRQTLNHYFLTDAGICELDALLRSGCYRVNVPEEGGLMAVAWLLKSGRLAEARTILEKISPWFDRLRFYPVPDACPISEGSTVYVRTVAQMIDDLKALNFPVRIEAMRETITVWHPILDEAVRLFMETVRGDLPSIRIDEDGARHVEGGWPCQHYPEDWAARGRVLLTRYAQQRRVNQLCGRPGDPRSNLYRLRSALAICVSNPGRMTGRDVGRVRLVLANILHKRGLPDSIQTCVLREKQAHQVSGPSTRLFVPVLVGRLSRHPRNDGLESLVPVLGAVTAAEARRCALSVGFPIPESLTGKLNRCRKDTPEALIEAGVITSGEVLARVIPQLTAQIRAAGIEDVGLRRLYHALYAAFRRRRSLLLLNLEGQVRFEELPWVGPLHARRRRNISRTRSARQALIQVVCTTLTAWPQTLLPNKMLQEVRALCEAAEVRIPITDELAADIFMHAFSKKFVTAAQQAAELLKGTLYERYYGLDYAAVQQINDVKFRWRQGSSAGFYKMCCALAGEKGGWGRVAQHGKIIEQGQILTTHNLASLFSALSLEDPLAPVLPELPRRCLIWVCRQHQLGVTGWQPRLKMVKNTAYAWRQMVFFLSLLSEDEVAAFSQWAAEHLSEQSADFAARFRPALIGLSDAIAGRVGGGVSEADLSQYTAWVIGRMKHSASAERSRLEDTHAAVMAQVQLPRRFLGWTTTPHWLLQGAGRSA